MLHFCPSCGHMSYHGPGSVAFALTCPACQTTARQEPHAPIPPKPERKPTPAAGGGSLVFGVASGTVTKAAAKRRRPRATP